MKQYILLFLMIAAGTQLLAQKKTAIHHRAAAPGQTASSGFNGTGANIDVVYHRAAWSVNPNNTTKYITGSITTFFKTIQPNVSSINFDFNKSSFNNTSLVVKWHGITCTKSFPTSGNTDILNITLPNSITAANTLDSVTIDYSGVPINSGFGSGFSAGQYTDQSGTVQRYLITLSESYEDKDWWPCKADMQDKIDSMDINVTVPWQAADTFWVASNGILTDSAISGTERTFHYKTRYPIASYLVCFAAAKYNRYYSSVNISGTNVPVYWYLLAGKSPAYYSNATTVMNRINQVVAAFSTRVGDYPFKLEKHGFYDGLIGAGGMEHQTFSAIASGAISSSVTLSHELMHQWFGDNVSFATWNDLWLAEGFATYGEILAAELVPSLGYSAAGRLSSLKTDALSENTISAWIPNSNIQNSNTIWNTQYGSAVYDRGGMIVSMLRAIAGDAKFFQALTNYQTRMHGRTATTDSVKQIFNEITGASAFANADLTEFFRDYVGGSGSADATVGGLGNPVYEVKWNTPSANTLVLGIQSQTQTFGSNVAYFNGPVVVRAADAESNMDTTITIFDHGNGNLSYAGDGLSAPLSGNALSYQLSFTPTEIFYDEKAQTLSTGSTVLDTTLKGYTWYGPVSSNWLDAANWASCCGVPPANANITIATITNTAQVPTGTTVHHLIINAGKSINLANSTLTITGTVSGEGTITGAVTSNLILSGKSSGIRLTQGSNNQSSLQSIILQPGSSASLLSNAGIKNVAVKPGANFTIAAGVNLITQ